jgi:hypothetical protein
MTPSSRSCHPTSERPTRHPRHAFDAPRGRAYAAVPSPRRVPGSRGGPTLRFANAESALSPTSLPRDWWGYHWSPPHPLTVPELIAAGSLDAELAALLWLWLEARQPLLVAAGPPLAGKSTTLAALFDFLPAGTRRVFVRGVGETFDWLPDASELGWRTDGHPVAPAPAIAAADPRQAYILVNELSSHLPIYTWGEQARVVLRAAGRGYGIAATLHAISLEGVFADLEGPPVSLTDDEIRRLGIVLILGTSRAGCESSGDWDPEAPDVRRRIVAAHYLRPVERDQGGHLQRRPPAVIATWDRDRDVFDHFAWGIADELAARVGRTPVDLAHEQDHRARFLLSLVDAGRIGPAEFNAAIAGYRHTHEPGHSGSTLAPAARP